MTSIRWKSFRALRRIRRLAAIAPHVLRDETAKYPPVVLEFEQAFAAHTGATFGLAFCNGTSCLEAALFAVGVVPGDRVLVPAFTFHATISPVLNAGAEVVYCDLDRRSANVDIEDFARKATAGIKVAVVTHLWGNPVNMTRFMRIAVEHGITVIEDCSHAHGAEWGGRRVGSFGAVGFFSLQSSKAVSSGGEGGIAVTSDRVLWERMLLYGHFDRAKAITTNPCHVRYGRAGCGHKLRAHPIAAALALVDLKGLDARNTQFRAAVEQLTRALSLVPGIVLVGQGQADARSGGFFGGLPLLLPDDMFEPVTSLLSRLGFQWSRVNYDALHRDPFMRDQKWRRELMRSSVTLPTSEPAGEVSDDCPNASEFVERLVLIELENVTPKRTAALAAAIQERILPAGLQRASQHS